MKRFLKETISFWKIDCDEDLLSSPVIAWPSIVLAFPLLLAASTLTLISRAALVIIGTAVLMVAVPLYGPVILVKMKRERDMWKDSYFQAGKLHREEIKALKSKADPLSGLSGFVPKARR